MEAVEKNLTQKRLGFKFLARDVIFKRNTIFYLNIVFKNSKGTLCDLQSFIHVNVCSTVPLSNKASYRITINQYSIELVDCSILNLVIQSSRDNCSF